MKKRWVAAGLAGLASVAYISGSIDAETPAGQEPVTVQKARAAREAFSGHLHNATEGSKTVLGEAGSVAEMGGAGLQGAGEGVSNTVPGAPPK